MNNQQAINLLKDLEKNLDDYCELNDEGKTAFGMAINALNCSEIPNNSDTISRQQAIDTLKEKVFHNLSDEFYGAMQVLDELPSAQPERIKGHWIEIASSNHTYKCSVCGRLLTNITDGKNKAAKNYPYCHCGADMRGEQDG